MALNLTVLLPMLESAGYNKRATVFFLMQEYAESIEDCLRVLDLEPFHFGALSGMGLCHLRMEDPHAALHAFERTLKVLNSPQVIPACSPAFQLQLLMVYSSLGLHVHLWASPARQRPDRLYDNPGVLSYYLVVSAVFAQCGLPQADSRKGGGE